MVMRFDNVISIEQVYYEICKITHNYEKIHIHKTTTYDVRNSNFRITPNLNVIQLCTWETWKITVTDAANESIGKSKPVKHYRNFWDKELDSLLKQRPMQTD